MLDTARLSAEESAAVAVAAISTWEREHLEVIEHRARRYLKKLDGSDGDTGGDSESELDEDWKALYAGSIRRSFGNLESRLENKFATLNFEQDGNRRYQSDQLNDTGHPIGLNKHAKNRWYTTGDANASSSRGIQLPLALGESRMQCQRQKGEKGRRSWTPASLLKQRGQKASDLLYLLTRAWRRGQISNYDYLMRINMIAGQSCHDPSHYPVMPWVLSNYSSETVPDLTDKNNFRNLSKAMGALDPNRFENS
eukprot:scaffold162153_cov55-Attheya_sp.AAC.1